jgi:hypothetical protein
MSKLIRNAMVTPDGTWLQSRQRHDYVSHTDANGLTYMVDGGLDYSRRSSTEGGINKCVYDDSPHEEQREAAEWGTYGKGGGGPLVFVSIASMSTDHIIAVLRTQPRVKEQLRNVMEAELLYRSA